MCVGSYLLEGASAQTDAAPAERSKEAKTAEMKGVGARFGIEDRGPRHMPRTQRIHFSQNNIFHKFSVMRGIR